MAKRLVASLKHRRETDGHNVVGVQGPPGVGKSTLALGLALNLDPSFHVGYVHYNRKEWHGIVTAPKGGIFILDEGANVAMNRTWADKDQTRLMQILNMIRQRNHTLLWATPNVQRLDIVVREDLLTHKINCFPTTYGRRARILTPSYGIDGQPSGWKRWPGILSWPSLEEHSIWTPYKAAKAANFQASASQLSSMSHVEGLGDPFGSKGLLDKADISSREREPGETRRDPVQGKVPKQKRRAKVGPEPSVPTLA